MDNIRINQIRIDLNNLNKKKQQYLHQLMKININININLHNIILMNLSMHKYVKK